MAASELFFPVGSLDLSDAQSAEIKSAFGHDMAAVPLYRVVPVSSGDRYVPLQGVPGLPGILVHYQDEDPVQGGKIIASVMAEMARGPDDSSVFAAHTKLMAPRAGSDAGKNGPPASGKRK
ncbi:hypothetical protein [Pandoraea terrigena]|uniref:Uncharacterized protein n=1 Tax=Pandoraea terrigena TaxID=2508292 RepID=A0A5E4VGE4_9BURK|nr:hypothetical protein [Pandoraea terrigena]VVE10634.1 hypothetical protein PTE31013_02630 [Pandoraea terrigena]